MVDGLSGRNGLDAHRAAVQPKSIANVPVQTRGRLTEGGSASAQKPVWNGAAMCRVPCQPTGRHGGISGAPGHSVLTGVVAVCRYVMILFKLVVYLFIL